jgi:hypothetical protein
VVEYHLNGNACAYCGQIIPGVWWTAGSPVGPAQAPAGRSDQ